MYASLKHKSLNSTETEFKLACKIRGRGGYKLVQVLYVSPRVIVTALDWQSRDIAQNENKRAIVLKANNNSPNWTMRVSQK